MSAAGLYLEQVLGVHEWIRQESPSFAVIFLSRSDLSQAELELFSRILGAVKLSPDSVGFMVRPSLQIGAVLPELECAQTVFCFDQELTKFIAANFSRVPLHGLPSLAEMIQNPASKREAWDVLRQAL